MDIKDVVINTISQIAEAIIESNGELKSKGVMVNPRGHVCIDQSASTGIVGTVNNTADIDPFILGIEFDLAPTIEKSQNSAGGAKVSVLSIGAGASINKEQISSDISRISFSIPIKFPNPVPDADAEMKETSIYYGYEKPSYRPVPS